MVMSTRVAVALLCAASVAPQLCVVRSTDVPTRWNPTRWNPSRELGDTGDRKHLRLDENPWPESGVRPWLSGLPKLPDTHAPASENWSNSIAICAIMKDENITDVAEWVAYHKWLGVDHIFLTDNNSTYGQEAREQLAAFFPSSFLSLQSEMEPRAQLKVYAWCAEEHRASYNWMSFLDVDEYIVLRGSSKKKGLKGLLNGYKKFGGLSVHWVVVGPSDRETRPESGGVLPYYKKCHTEVHPAVKTIANTWYLSGICVHPHNVQSRGDVWSVNEDKQLIHTAWHARPEYRERGGGNAECQRSQDESKCFKSPAVRHRPAVANKIAIYHYVSKSREDFKAKLVRGAGLPYFERDEKWFDIIREGEREDPMCEEPSEIADECCSEIYDGTLLLQSPSTAHSLGPGMYYPGHSVGF